MEQGEEMINEPIKRKYMYIQLKDKDYNEIANVIVGSEKDRGIEYIDINGLEFEVIFSKSIDGYVEDDYNNGTGAFVCTMAEVEVKDIKCGDVEVRCNRRHIENIAETLLKL